MKRVQAGAHNPERVSPFLDTFLGNFPAKMESLTRL